MPMVPKYPSITLLALALLAGAARADTLAARLNALVADPQLKGSSLGLHVVEITPTGPVEIYSHNADAPLAPASNCKILTTAAAFERYGPKATFKTRLFKVGDDLILVGSGDPGLGDETLLNQAGMGPTQIFDDWADALHKSGLTSYHNLILDERVFDAQYFHPNWPANQRGTSSEARIGGLNFSDNIKNGTVVTDPGALAGTSLQASLAKAGIASTGQLLRIAPDAKFDGTLLAFHETPILSVLTRANTDSVNMMAEGLCKRLGHDATDQPGTWQNGTDAVKAYLKSLKIPDGDVTLDDGSGLSDKNRVTARAFTTVLAHVAARPDGALYVQTFAVPGEGSLIKRFKDAATAPAAKAIHAKTGHINNVSTLSGYIEAGGRHFAFSILCGDYYKNTPNVNPWQDQVCAEIYKWALTK